MKALTIRQPWASLIAHGIKTIETRPGPSYGPGKVPGLTIARGERFAIHSGLKRPAHCSNVGPFQYLHQDIDRICDTRNGIERWIEPALGAIVATAVLVDCVPIVLDPDDFPDPIACVQVAPNQTELVIWPEDAAEPGEEVDITDQLPYGDFTPGRWAWLLGDVHRVEDQCPMCGGEGGDWRIPCPLCHGSGGCAPIPWKGRQGVWEWTP